MLTVVMLVALRLALGCHFLYEGLWKIRPIEKFSTKHHEDFTAEPFLTQAKGPLSWVFYAMLPDVDGRKTLMVLTDGDGKKSIDSTAIAARWNEIRQQFVDFYRPGPTADDSARQTQLQLEKDAEKTFTEFRGKLDDYFQENVDDIAAWLGTLDRFQADDDYFARGEGRQNAPFQQQRRWQRMLDLRGEAGKWIKDIEAQEKAFSSSLYGLLAPQQKQRGQVPESWNPLRWGRTKQINFAVTYGLTAIGVCLMLGFFTPLAALGGGRLYVLRGDDAAGMAGPLAA